jgi:hypothetical protein
MMEHFIGVYQNFGFERAASFFLLNPFVVILTVGVTTCVAILISLLYILRKWGN